jgi:hypothetical protein
MGFNFQSHKPMTSEGIFRGYKVDPYVTVKIGEHTVNIQGGSLWGSGGQLYDLEDIPSVIWDAIEKMPEASRQSLGIDKLKRPGAVLKKGN